MSPDSEPLRRVPEPAAELHAESEVDFSRYARAVLGKWWLLLVGVVVGAALGFAYGQAGGTTYEGEATVYLGAPLSPSGSPVATLASDPSGVASVARSQSVVKEVSDQVGIPVAKLRNGISSRLLGERNRQTSNVNLIGITVRGSDGDKVEQAANLLAERVIAATSGYADAKVEELQQRLETEQAQLDSLSGRIDQIAAGIDTGGSADPTQQLLVSNLLAVLEQQRAEAASGVFQTQQLLTAAQEIEQGKVVSQASAIQVDARNTRTSTIVGAFIGLLVAVIAALLWAPAQRLRSA
jgi:uncharacterized protein involved in exopolysaccharide biosynthesis